MESSEIKFTRLQQRSAGVLFKTEEERELFLSSLVSSNHPPLSKALIWLKSKEAQIQSAYSLPNLPAESWQPWWLTQLDPQCDLKLSDGFSSGDFYPIDRSSALAASALLTLHLQSEDSLVVDLCASPGGKTLFAKRALNPARLLSNEVHGKRLQILRHNLKTSALSNLFTQNLQPEILAQSIINAADAVLVDAPCSGQSMPVKGIPNPGAWHPAIINGNATRQRRILASAATMVRAQGHLLYTTCTFAPEENEKNIRWFLKRFPEFRAVDIHHLVEWRSPLYPEIPTYRFYPHLKGGAGAFSALLKKEDTATQSRSCIEESLFAWPVAPPSP